jgi:hypothetical protein
MAVRIGNHGTSGAKETGPNAILENGKQEINRIHFNSVYECSRVRFPALQEKKTKVVGLERGPLSLVSTTEELLDKKK